MRSFLPLTLAAANLCAQSSLPISVSGGFKIGAPINDSPKRYDVFSTYDQSRWTGGPAVELHLPYRFSIQFEALYRTYREKSTYPFRFDRNASLYLTQSDQKTNVWDFPLMVKYRFQVGSIRPFVNAGYYWSRESSERSSFYSCTGPEGSCLPPGSPFPDPRGGYSENTSTQRGIVAGAGIEFKMGHLRISPEVRFSRPTYGSPRDNRFTGMVGFTFGKK